MSFLASTSRTLHRALAFSSASPSRHLSASACTLEKITRPSGSGPAPYSQQDGDATRDVLAQLAKGLKETGPSPSEGFSSGELAEKTGVCDRAGVDLCSRAVPSTPIQTFRNGQVRPQTTLRLIRPLALTCAYPSLAIQPDRPAQILPLPQSPPRRQTPAPRPGRTTREALRPVLHPRREPDRGSHESQARLGVCDADGQDQDARGDGPDVEKST